MDTIVGIASNLPSEAVLGSPALYVITGHMWDTNIPLALVEANNELEAVEIFWDRVDNAILEEAGMGGSPDKERFKATPVDLNNGYQWIGAVA